LGEDIYPQNFIPDLVDEYVRIGDKSGINMTRLLPMTGFLGGQSSGAAYLALLKLIETNKINISDNVFIIYPDTALPYRKDAFDDKWLKQNNLNI
jgi:cysteine synthase